MRYTTWSLRFIWVIKLWATDCGIHNMLFVSWQQQRCGLPSRYAGMYLRQYCILLLASQIEHDSDTVLRFCEARHGHRDLSLQTAKPIIPALPKNIVHAQCAFWPRGPPLFEVEWNLNEWPLTASNKYIISACAALKYIVWCLCEAQN